jgi:DNA-binding winged helix-turn-helix (wHTH) protein/Tol biopolymer transport system component
LHPTTARNELARLRFGAFEVDQVEGRLYKRGVPLRIENHPFLVLLALLDRPDAIVTREELQRRIWGDGTNVGFDDGLNAAVRKLRAALGDAADSPLFIETVPKKGYRFIAPLSGANGSSSPHGHDPVESGPDRETRLVPDISQDPGKTRVQNFPRASSPKRSQLVALGVILLFATMIAVLVFWRGGRPEWLASGFSTLQARRLEGVHTGQSLALSPDGHYVAYVRSAGRMSSVRLRQVSNAGEVEILPPREAFYVGLTISPDGNELYFVRTDEDDFIYKSLYRMPILGGPTQRLIEDIDSPVSFSPDGLRFVFARFRPATSTLEIRTANADGSREELFTEFPGYAWGCTCQAATWSPDGRTIAVAFRGILNPSQSSLYIVDVATRRADEVHSGSGCIGRLVWTPDNELTFFHGSDLWTMKDRVGTVRRVAGYGGSLGGQMDLSRDGQTAIATGYQVSEGLWSVPVQPVSAAKQLISGDASLDSVDEMIDGRVLVTKEDSSIWTTKADGSDWQSVTNVRGKGKVCGQFVLVRMRGDGSLVRMRADGTGAMTLAHSPTQTETCSLKGDSVFYVTRAQPHQIMRIALDGGNPVTIAKIPKGVMESLSISPDGSFLAYTYYNGNNPKNGFAVLRTRDAKLIQRTEGPKLGIYTFQWAPDAKSIDYLSGEDQRAEVWEQPLVGGKLRRITHFGSGYVSDFHWSRDGKRLLVVWGPVREDVVLLSGLR